MPEVVENSSEHFSSVSENKTQNSFGLYNHIRGVNITNGQANFLTSNGKDFVEDMVTLCQPDQVHICDGSDVENKFLLKTLVECGTIVPLPKYENCWLARTHPGDVARVESKTFICTPHKQAVITNTEIEGPKSLGNWISPEDMNKAIQERFPGCMKGRTMYVVPFSMGPVESPLSKIGIQVTDSAYVAASMRIMTRMGICALEKLKQHDEFVKCVHSVGTPRDGFVEKPSWPCDPERTIILHKPQENLIVSYGSGYGGNSLLGKKCFALRIGSTIAKREGWLAEHMLILGITNPKGEKKYITAAFPSACGKTNLAMLKPSLANYKVECVGDDIAWMRFDEDGVLRAINPENGFFGVAPGTSDATNPMAMKTIFKNTIFTNVASTSDGGVFWEGMESSLSSDIEVTDWLGNKWEKNSGRPAAHPNSRFCSPASQCPIIDAAWEDPKGVPISAILFGGRRPKGVPLIYEANSWAHGVLIGASMRSEATAAAEHRGKIIMHDPFAMRPFFGYNFGHYLKHWLDMEKNDRKMPKIFHVNWFLKNSDGKFLWPGYGENARVLEWVLKRIDGEKCFTVSPIGCLPGSDSINCKGLSDEVDMEKLLCVDKQFWLEEIKSLGTYFESQVGLDMPEELRVELKQFEQRIKDL